MASLWKWFALMVVLVMAMADIASSTALAAETKTEAVNLSSTVSGNTVTFTAVTLKDGSSFADSWTGAANVSTVLNANGYYVSTATFDATGLAAGTYNVSYHITMTAGTSDVSWTGGAAGTVTTDGPNSGIPPRAGTSGMEI